MLPGQLQIRNIACRNLCERRVTLTGLVVPVRGPVSLSIQSGNENAHEENDSKDFHLLLQLTWCFDALLEHLDSFFQPSEPGFFFFGFSDPAAVFLTVRITQLLEKRKQSFFLHQFLKFGRNLDSSLL